MGNCWVAFKSLIESIPGLDVVLPPPVNRKTIELGAKYSPEFVCFPFKVNVGDFIQTYEQYGVKIFINAIDCGPCRFGFYHAVQERILKDLGYDLTIIQLDQADLLEFKWLKTFNILHDMTGEKNKIKRFYNILNAAIIFLKKAKITADMEKLEAYFLPRETKKGMTVDIMNRMLKLLDQAKTIKQVQEARPKIIEEFLKIPIDESLNPLRVKLTGEIHVTLEPYVNLDLKRKLGSMGIEVHQDLSLIDWVLHKFHINFHRKALEEKARPYLPLDIGGEAQWVLGEYIEAMEKGLDGFIHIYPFTCMPENTARGIITAMDEPKLPVIFFSFDEHTGVEGMRTRLESFVELMEDKRRKGQNIKPIEKYQNHQKMIDEIIKNHRSTVDNIIDIIENMLKIGLSINPIEALNQINYIVNNLEKI